MTNKTIVIVYMLVQQSLSQTWAEHKYDCKRYPDIMIHFYKVIGDNGIAGITPAKIMHN